MRIVFLILALCLSGFVYNNAADWRHELSYYLYTLNHHSEPQSAPVTMYALTTCGICKYMAAQMDSAGIPYVKYYIDADPSRKRELIQRLDAAHVDRNQVNVAPIIFAGSHVYWGRTPISAIQSAMAQ